MNIYKPGAQCVRAAIFCLLAALLPFLSLAQQNGIDPRILPRVGSIDERFQSYNIEMVEVIGGRFWKPYGKKTEAAPLAQPSAKPADGAPAGMSPDLYEQRPPIDLSNPKLRKLAAGLAPAYVRVSGTWANTTYFHNSDAAAPATPPPGFKGVLTRSQWKGVVDFSQAVDAKIVTSVATSPGTRDSAGVWTPAQAKALLDYTQSIGGAIAATEFMNEPTLAAMGGAPKGYDAASYGRDIAVFKPFLKQVSPETILLGPGSVSEGGKLSIPPGTPGMLRSEDLLQAAGDAFDAFSYHYYGAVSERCASVGAKLQTTAEAALTPEWLTQTDTVEAFYARLRDRYAPHKPLWVTETADAACGGDPWGSTFTDSFRYLYQMGSLAQRGVQVIMHNTLAASDYGLIDQTTLTPRPNYWAALLWRRLMGTTVLDAGARPKSSVQIFSHCLRNKPGGVALLVLNTEHSPSQMDIPIASERYTLTAKNLADTTVQLNGQPLGLNESGDLPQVSGTPLKTGKIVFPPQSITFLALPHANNDSCK